MGRDEDRANIRPTGKLHVYFKRMTTIWDKYQKSNEMLCFINQYQRSTEWTSWLRCRQLSNYIFFQDKKGKINEFMNMVRMYHHYVSIGNVIQVRFPMTCISDVEKKSESQTNGELISVNFLKTCKQFINRSFCKIRHCFRPYSV